MDADILIRGAQVFDGGDGPPVEADVAIQGDRISAVGRETPARSARRILDGRGLAAAPGFVDIHGHSDYHLLLTPTAESAVLQGVTCEVGGNCGYAMSEENLRAILQKPYVMIGSDSGCRAHYGPLSTGRPHPRTFGSFARVLGHYARDERLFDLSTAIRKMTSDPCRRLGLADRGRLRPGYKADVVLFDPARVRDTASYEEPIRYPEGVHTVLVNGAVTVEAGRHTGARAGQVVRRT